METSYHNLGASFNYKTPKQNIFCARDKFPMQKQVFKQISCIPCAVATLIKVLSDFIPV